MASGEAIIFQLLSDKDVRLSDLEKIPVVPFLYLSLQIWVE